MHRVSRSPIACARRLALLSLAGALLLACSDGDGRGAVADSSTDAGAADVGDAPDVTEETGPPLASAEVAEPGPYAVGAITLDLEDLSRPTAANGDFAGAPSRLLVTDVWYPAAAGSPGEAPQRDAEPAAGPFPLIVYSHGFMSGRNENIELCVQLASLGIVVAAPEYPLTSNAAPGGPNVYDVVNQPADVSFLIDELLTRSNTPDAPFGALDDDRVALAGASLGAMTSLVTGFHPDFRDSRVRAVLAAAPPGCFLPADIFGGLELPLLVVHGDLDELLPYDEHALPTFAAATPPKWLVTFEGGTHTAFGAVAVDLLARLDNPESLGCAALAGNPSIADGGLAELAAESLGVSVEQAAACPVPCSTEGPRPTSMNARRQLDLFLLVATAFFQEQLLGDARHGYFLDVTLAEEQADVTVQAAR